MTRRTTPADDSSMEDEDCEEDDSDIEPGSLLDVDLVNILGQTLLPRAS